MKFWLFALSVLGAMVVAMALNSGIAPSLDQLATVVGHAGKGLGAALHNVTLGGLARALAMLAALALHGVLLARVSALPILFGKSAPVKPWHEIPLPVLAAAFWVLAGALVAQPASGLLAGIGLGLGLAATYAAVRSIDAADKRMAGLASDWARADGATGHGLAKSAIYGLRQILVTVSFLAVLALLAGANDAAGGLIPAFPVLALLVAVATITILLTARGMVATRMALARDTVRPVFDAALAQSGHTILHYISDPAAKKFTASVDLIGRLKKEGREAAVLARDAAAPAVLTKAGAGLIYRATSVTDLDKFASRRLQTVLYVNDHEKNGQFTRFTQFSHVLFPSGKLAKVQCLPRSLAMYDCIVAPSLAVGEMWFSRSSPDLAAKVAVVGAPSMPILRHPGWIPAQPVVGAYLDPKLLGGDMLRMLDRLVDLMAILKTMPAVRICLAYPDATAKSQPSMARQQRVVKQWMENKKLAPRIEQRVMKLTSTANYSDIYLALSRHGEADLARAEKPVVWLGDPPGPAGYYPGASSVEAFAQIIADDPMRATRAQIAEQMVLTGVPVYRTIALLLAEVEARRGNGRGRL